MSDTDAIILDSKNPVTVETAPDDIDLGRWYWVRDSDDSEWLGCVTHLGSNYVEMKSVHGGSVRVHLDEFNTKCRPEPDASHVIEQEVLGQKAEVKRLMEEVIAITARLGVGQTAALGSGSEGQALARLDPKQDVKKYKTDLVKAKTEELPALFKKIERANEELVTWMKAETMPMKAQLGKLDGVIRRIDDRIFNVELYAGLTEQVALIADGEPAGLTEKIRLMQRRCYMDEECLAQYEVGGMEFKDIRDFDAWLVRTENRDRILPFPRCIVAFRVRRHMKQRSVPTSFVDFFNMIDDIRADELTFLFIRNGERVYRMSTELEFGEQLFPDTDHNNLTAGTKLWANMFGGSVSSIITDAQFQGLCEDHEAKKAAHAVERSAHAVKLKVWREAKRAAKAAGQEFKEREPYLFSFSARHPRQEHELFEPDNIYYDDMVKKISAEIRQSNRIAIIIQGLLDRSVVLHPHPPWKIWSPEGASLALEMIFDASRALVGGERPDFVAYRDQLNASLKVGSITVGQYAAWVSEEDNDGARKKKHYRDPGPGTLARIVEYQRNKGRCGYAWHRDGEGHETFNKKIRARFVCNRDQVLNVDAYKPGDFRRFFADPRTRADYLEWAPFLLEAEEYHAGNRTVEDPPPPSQRESSWEGQRAYRRRRERQLLVGKRVRLAHAVTTRGGAEYAEGSLWRVTHTEGGGLTIHQLADNGEDIKNGAYIRCMAPNDLVLDEL